MAPTIPEGYVAAEELEAMNQHHNQEQDDLSWGTIEDLKQEAQQIGIHDIAPLFVARKGNSALLCK